MKRPIIFTDLDGTLLDHATYSFEGAQPALALLRQMGVPVVICSSKTRAEIEHYRRKLSNHHPFISENGGGVFIPKGYFKNSIHHLPSEAADVNDYHLIRLGANYRALREIIEKLRDEGFGIKGFGDMSVKEIAENTGLDIREAAMARERDFDEPFVFEGDSKNIPSLLNAITEKGFHFTQGRFYHLLGNSDKGKAVSLLIEWYRKEFGGVVTVALGDSPNDIPMLKAVDCPIIVKKPDGGYDQRIDIANAVKADGIGPEGWNKAILNIFDTMSNPSGIS